MQKHGVVLPPLLAQQAPISHTISPQVKSAVQAAIGDQQRFMTNSKQPQKPNDSKIAKPAQPAGRSTADIDAVSPTSGQKKVKFHVFQPKMMKFSDNVAGTDERPSAIEGGIPKKEAAGPNSAVQPGVKPPAPKRPKKTASQKAPTNVPVGNATSTISGSLTQFKFVDCTADVANAVELQQANRGGTSSSPVLPSANSIQRLIQQESISFSSSPPPNTDAMTTAKRPAACNDGSCPKRSAAAIHYHCEKCEFWTPESTKWHVHVKQHARMDQVAALGFRKVLAGGNNGNGDGSGSNASSATTCPLSVDCSVANQSHYHCMTCNSAALTQSQMSAHKTTKHPDLDTV